MKHSVFWKIIIGLLIIIVLGEAVMMFFLYQYTYNHAVEDATDNIKYAADSVSHVCEAYDPDNLDDYKDSTGFLNDICQGLDITYLYVIKPDIENKNELYLARGWGDNASEEFVNHRYSGYVARGMLSEEHIRAFKGERNVLLHKKNEYDDTLLCFTPVKRCYSLEKGAYIDEIKSIVCAEVSLSKVMHNFNQRYSNFVLLIIGVTFLILITTGIILYFRVSRPLRLISGRMNSFISKDGTFFEKLPVKGKDEIAEMSGSFNTMAEDIDRYICELSELNRQKAELNIARTIQIGLLKPQNYLDDDISINASMIPAKDVGGDLYDYRVLDDGNIFVTIADVAGKGVTAALFMSRAVTLLSHYAKLGYSPAKMLSEYNRSLAERNPQKLFITTFVAIYNPKTKELTYSNAGHNYPYIISDKLITLDKKCGVAAGVFRNAKYTEYSIKLKDGDKLFLFTDGITEARNKNDVLFGEEALEKVLVNASGADADGLIKAVKNEIAKFSDGTEQSDDMTMLSLQIIHGKTRSLCVEANKENLESINKLISEFDIPDNLRSQISVIAGEAFNNICSNSYPDAAGDVDFSIAVKSNKVIMTFADKGIPLNRYNNDLDEQEKFNAFPQADGYSYECAQGKNILIISKQINCEA